MAQFLQKISKNECFTSYAHILMTYINFPVHGHIKELFKEIGFSNCHQFYTDATMVSKKFKEEVIHGN